MILLLDTSTSECRITYVDGNHHTDVSWQAERELAHGLLRYVVETLASLDATIEDLNGIGVLRGPGSFTGLRIGMTTMNTIANAQDIAIVGEVGEDWQQRALKRLRAGENDRIVLPEYGREARITQPRK